jgi:hypothetical protein
MSFNLSTRLNNLYQVVQNIQTTALTNPMVANLNMASYSVNNATSVNAPASTPITLNADPAQGVVINTKVSIPNHTLMITNNTLNDSFVVKDSNGDTSVFRVDNVGSVGVKVDPATPLTTDFTVNGTANITGNLTAQSITAPTINGGSVISNITAGTGIVKSGTSTNPTISNSGLLGLSPSNAGSGITIGGTATNPTISNSGLLGLTSSNAGSGIAISGTATNPTISFSGSTPSSSPTRVSRVILSGNNTFPINGGAVGTQGIALSLGDLYEDFQAGTSPDPNGVWILDLSPISVLLTGNVNSGFITIGLGDDLDSNVYYPSSSTLAPCVLGSPPATYGLINYRAGGCPFLALKVSDVLATLPNFMASSFQVLSFSNGSSDALWLQLRPSFIQATYYPYGLV